MILSLRVVRLVVLLAAAFLTSTAYAAGGKATIYQYDSAGNLVAVIDTLTDAKNCGALGNACPSATNGTAQCRDGKCGLVCKDGFLLCGSSCQASCAAAKAKL